ncbi:MAG: chromosome segregation protein SMC [Synergistales bacterium]|nr:chromosome segregation protein SMC [Synergistales bacterium]
MYIRQICLDGFKSFGGRHELPVSPGFTAVVGPNGSGKSNLLDALRWVLGDNHAGRLRIVRQNELVFQGSLSLPGAREASASLQLEQEGRVTAVKRTVSPDGTSQVTVDGRRARLQDLDRRKQEWNLEGDRFAFIGQGEVAEMIRLRPAQRREHLETLFGIDAYRRKRSGAVDKLSEVEEELRRIRTLRAELQTRREEIAPRVAEATEAKAIEDRLDILRRDHYWTRVEEIDAELAQREGELTADRSLEERARFLAAGWKRGVAPLEERRQRLEEQLKHCGGEKRSARDRCDALLRKGFTSAVAVKEHRRRLQELSRRSGEMRERIGPLEKELKAKESHYSELEARAEELREHRVALEEEWTRKGAEARKARQLLSTLRERRGGLEDREGRLRGRLSALGSQYAETGKRRKAEEAELGSHRKGDDGLAETLAERERCLREARQRLRELGEHCKEEGARYQRAQRDLARERAALESLEDEAVTSRYPKPVQHLLSAAKLGRIDVGPVPAAETFSCGRELVPALEAFLGGRQYWLFTETMDETSRCLDHLKRAAVGRATFLPLERARPRSPQRGFRQGDLAAVGWAVDLVEIEKAWKPCVEHLLGDLLIVESDRDGRQAVRQGARFPLVTLEGDVFLPGGTISGGRQRKKTGAIEQKRRIDEAKRRVAELQAQTENRREAFEAAEREEERAAGAATAAETALKEAQEAKRRAEEACSESERRLEGIRKESEELQQGLSRSGRELMALLGEKAEVDQRIASLGSPRAAVPTDLEGRLASARQEEKLAVERVDAARALLERLRREAREARDALENLEGEHRRIEDERESHLGELRRIGREYLTSWEQLGSRDGELRRLSSEDAALRREARRKEARLEAARKRLQALRHRIEQAEMSRSALRREREELVDSWEERFPYPGPGTIRADAGARSLRSSMRALEREQRALGAYDLGVLSEDASLEERLSYLDAQLADLQQGREELQGFISHTDHQAGELFSAAMEGINNRFDSLFGRLFGGGEAYLRLTGDATLWDAGVEVIARPPGKKPQHIGQLSGGEQSLTAISLLFAAMEIAQVPLAVLDEVDAALDEVNLRRFADLAREYAARIQLLVMTHRRYTMEQADLLYGVTMREPGLSQVVGVRLEDWE